VVVVDQLLLLLWRMPHHSLPTTPLLSDSISRFHPPEPLYEIRQNKSSGEYSIELFPEIHPLHYPEGVHVHRIQTKTKSYITLLYVPCPGAHFTVIFSHGNATDCGGMYNHYLFLAKTLNVNVIGYDYTGYGPCPEQEGGEAPSPLGPSESQVYLDMEAVYNWCCVNVTTDPGSRVILYGQSVGSGPSCYLASRQPVAGVILHSAILSGVRVLTSSRLLACCDIFPNIDRIKRIRCPVFIIHGMVLLLSPPSPSVLLSPLSLVTALLLCSPSSPHRAMLRLGSITGRLSTAQVGAYLS
jgi:abhydrolase domain-containing protein 17